MNTIKKYVPISALLLLALSWVSTTGLNAGTHAAQVQASAQRPQYPCNLPVPALQKRAPGELLAWHDITPDVASDSDASDFPASARAWRIQYVSTGPDNTRKIAVCAVIVAPDRAADIHKHVRKGRLTGRVVAWSHGTLGMIPRCQPSYTPESLIWGPTPYGIGAVQWGSEQSGDAHRGAATEGIMAGMIEDGLIIAASDYHVDRTGRRALHPYALGKIEAANIIDSIRAGHELLRKKYRPNYHLDAYDVVTWGHSQGAHAAMFAGQLLPSYTAATARAGDPVLALSGVALEAAPAMLVTPADRVTMPLGFSDLDWLANAQTEMTGVPEPIPGAPFIFSFLFNAWATIGNSAGLYRPNAMPAAPDVGSLDPRALISPEAESAKTLEAMSQLCWSSEDGAKIAELALPYKTTPFLVSAVADGPVIDGFQHGGFDQTCAAPPSQDLANWCAWFQYNNLGPLGVNDLEKLPKRGRQLAPVYIAQGNNDQLVHCVASADEQNQIPAPERCQASLLYESLRPIYCPADAQNGYLELNIWPAEDGLTLANHSDITGLVAASSPDNPTYRGSRLHAFISGAFDGTLKPGCSASLVTSWPR
ncbi:MAG: hypothetical protein EOM20_17235 [Spartobacteria bacterium]|nr:hypothetical protein [Spartobacteria bacterium]